jgi:adenine nucleotide transporter 17
MSSPSLLPSLAHALSGSTGTAISTVATYPLDLVSTRLKVQRQLSSSQSYTGVLDAFRRIYATEGGLRAFFVGLRADTAKSVVDSFLFFLFYNWFRARRLHGRRRHLNAAEELAIGAVAGAAARLFTTPVANVVTRRQTASLVSGEAERDRDKSFGEVLKEIRREKGILGLWAGYSASLVLTLNPSITFFLQQTLTKRVLRNESWDSQESVGTGTMFVLAAVSKAVATGLTYPFQIAKARVQVSRASTGGKTDGSDRGEGDSERGYRLSDKTERLAKQENLLSERTEELAASARKRAPQSNGSETIFGTVARIRREEGIGALYDGLQGELLKAFFSHGVTMVSKDVVHKLLFRLYFAILAYLNGHPQVLMALLRLKYALASVPDTLSVKDMSAKMRQLWRQRNRAAETAKAAAESALNSGKEAADTARSAAQSAFNSSEGLVSSAKEAAENSLSSGKTILSNAVENGQRKIFE